MAPCWERSSIRYQFPVCRSKASLTGDTKSFVMTKVCYNALPMSAFTTLQKRVFPVYFRGQTLLLLFTALTHPPYGPVSLVASIWDLIPLAFGGAMAALNLMVWGPRAQTAMTERIHQGGPVFVSRPLLDADTVGSQKPRMEKNTMTQK